MPIWEDTKKELGALWELLRQGKAPEGSPMARGQYNPMQSMVDNDRLLNPHSMPPARPMDLEQMMELKRRDEFMRKLMEQMQRRHRGQYVNQQPNLPTYSDSGSARPGGEYDTYLWHLLQRSMKEGRGPILEHPLQRGGEPNLYKPPLFRST